MDILIIGNGFDLEHNLPTKYTDFLGFIKYFSEFTRLKNKKGVLKNHLIREIDISDLKKTNNFLALDKNIQSYLNKDENIDPLLQSNILKELYDLASYNIWIKHFEEHSKMKLEGWIDFESEISDIIKSLDKLITINESSKDEVLLSLSSIDNRNMYKDKSVVKGVKFIEKFSENVNESRFYSDNSEEFIDKMHTDLKNLIRCLEIYLSECVEKINIEKESSDIKNLKNIELLINFNYTNTYKRVYEKYKVFDIENNYIHGNVDATRTIEDNNMVLGIDEYLSNDIKDTDTRFIRFKKYFQRIYKDTDFKYKGYIDDYKIGPYDDEENNIFIFGHSLDITDKDILKELISDEDFNIIIFYHSKNSKAELIENLVKLIGSDNLNEWIGRRISFEEQNKIEDKKESKELELC